MRESRIIQSMRTVIETPTFQKQAEIYFNLTEQEVVLLVAAYAKAERANMLPVEIKKMV